MEKEAKKIALHHVHEGLQAKMVEFAGYMMPVRYSSDIEEHKVVRENAGIFDVSHMGEFYVEGPHALPLIQKVTSNDASKLTDGKAQYSCLPNAEGGIIDDLIVYRINNEKYLLVVNASNIEKDWDWIKSHNTMGATLTNVSDEFSLFAIQGPKAAEILQNLTEVKLAEMPFYSFQIGQFAGQSEVIISATGYTGAGGFELYVPNSSAEKVWNAVMEKGAPKGLKPAGLAARDTLRLEMGYCLYGNDIDDQTNPIEAGLSWITKFTKDFTASEKIQSIKEQGVTRKLVGLIMEEKGIPRRGYEVVNEQDEVIGEITSGTISPILQKGIAMAYVSLPYTGVETELFIKVRNKNLKAKVVKPPFIK